MVYLLYFQLQILFTRKNVKLLLHYLKLSQQQSLTKIQLISMQLIFATSMHVRLVTLQIQILEQVINFFRQVMVIQMHQ
ncbi:hypothetical protein C2U68_08880 [Methylomonas koyamae]|nr:hypothetical protein C2U68_08880 [Methylomonas koyamae]